ncbi:hypothetical protein [Kitasatospora sp. NPDC094015]|uniref:hypothetical protein n=1 Tax=Kitasatospora sp. NPDC094015 TaxID=3155205 RepID=UPI0033295A3D
MAATEFSYGCRHAPDTFPLTGGPYRIAAERRLCADELRAVAEAEHRLAGLGALRAGALDMGVLPVDGVPAGALPVDAPAEALPWSRALPPDELTALAQDLADGLRGSARTGHPAVFANELAAWRATAEAAARPGWAATLRGPFTTTRTELTCPGPLLRGHLPDDGLKPAHPELRAVWDQLLHEHPAGAATAWSEVMSEPLKLDCLRTPLRGALGTATIGGRELEHWAYRGADGLRLWYAPDPVARETWVTGLAGPLPARRR